jgi:hypothetical protein
MVLDDIATGGFTSYPLPKIVLLAMQRAGIQLLPYAFSANGTDKLTRRLAIIAK